MKAHANPYAWNRGKSDEQHGVKITNRMNGGYVFIHCEGLYSIADTLVGIAEQYEKETD